MFMKIKRKAAKNKKNSFQIDNLSKAISKSTSLWRILAVFMVINLVIINIINYWQPFNHKDVSEIYIKQQKAIFSAYDLHKYLTDFKKDPDQNAYHLVQKTVTLNNSLSDINKIDRSFDITAVNNLNDNVESITSGLPSIKLFNENLDRNFRKVAALKYQIITSLDSINKNDDNNDNISAIKNLYITVNKLEDLLQKLKYNFWTSKKIAVDFQNNLEGIGLDLEQYESSIMNTEKNTELLNSLKQIFNDIGNIMPTIFNLTNIARELEAAESNQEKILQLIKSNKIDYLDKVDDKLIVIITIVILNFILLCLVITTKVLDKVRNIYTHHRTKREIQYLTHDSESNTSLSSKEQKDKVSTDDAILTINWHDNHKDLISNILKLKDSLTVNNIKITSCINQLGKIDKTDDNFEQLLEQINQINRKASSQIIVLNSDIDKLLNVQNNEINGQSNMTDENSEQIQAGEANKEATEVV